MNQASVGICDMALYVPKLHLPIEVLAEARNLEYIRLNKGLGLTRMVVPDVHEDSATMAANAVSELIDKNKLNPQSIGRIYLGTESALDGAKPTATYILEMLRRKYKVDYGIDCFQNCDVVDLTFACVGGVDALHNTLDWVRGDRDRIGIVVTSDFAKYELESGGEYTQGAGAIAMLVKHDPRLIVIDDVFGVATQGVHDFYKPRRSFSKKDIVSEVLSLANIKDLDAEKLLKNLPETLKVEGILDDNDSVLELYKDTPIFDGQYSNWTYQNRIREAYLDYCKKNEKKGDNNASEDVINQWDRLIFHLPYAFHGKRIASELFMFSMKNQGKWNEFSSDLPAEPRSEEFENNSYYESARVQFLRAITKTPAYKDFVTQKLEKAQRASSLVGNMYACSIFLALMSTLESDLGEPSENDPKKLGFFGYGSGSKSKVFQGRLQPNWKEVVSQFNIFEKLEQGKAIDYNTYEQIHRKQAQSSMIPPKNEFVLDRIGSEGVRLGARYYEWVTA
jgi:hydroxymethylglutaryl-CoA synthase